MGMRPQMPLPEPWVWLKESNLESCCLRRAQHTPLHWSPVGSKVLSAWSTETGTRDRENLKHVSFCLF